MQINLDILYWGYAGLGEWQINVLVRTVVNCAIQVNLDFRFADPDWVCRVGLMSQVSQDPTTTRVHWY